jgi:hypothetical protein
MDAIALVRETLCSVTLKVNELPSRPLVLNFPVNAQLCASQGIDPLSWTCWSFP